MSLQATNLVTLSPSKDNTLYESNEGMLSNGVGQHFFVGRTNQSPGISTRRGLLAFDVTDQIPAGSTILSVTLKLKLSIAASSVTRPITLHHLLQDWGEGTSDALGAEGRGITATLGDATWRHRSFDTVLWTTSGGVFSPTARASAIVGGIGTYNWGSTPEMVADVQTWLDQPSNNFGWLLRGEESVPGTARRFDSRENPTPANRPLLTVTFSPPLQVFLPLIIK